MQSMLTSRLELISMTPAFLEASLAGDRDTAEAALGLSLIPDEWLEDRWLIELRLGDLRGDPSLGPWLLRALRRRDDGVMIGHIGFHGRPGSPHLDEYLPGGVEIGYTVFTPYRRQGYAAEALAGLIGWAAAQAAPGVVLSIAPDNAPSQAIARRFGFVKVGEQIDEIDGVEEVFIKHASVTP